MRANNVRPVPRERADDLGKGQRSHKNTSSDIIGYIGANLRRRSILYDDSVKSAAAHFATKNPDIGVALGIDASVVSGDRHIVGAQE